MPKVSLQLCSACLCGISLKDTHGCRPAHLSLFWQNKVILDLCACVHALSIQVLAVYLASVWPILFHRLVQHRIGRSVFVVVFSFLLLVVACVWVTAYNFVPVGGTYTRERTDILLAVSIALIGLGTCVRSTSGIDLKKTDELPPNKSSPSGPPPLAKANLSSNSKQGRCSELKAGFSSNSKQGRC